jgi:hypothetical protein
VHRFPKRSWKQKTREPRLNQCKVVMSRYKTNIVSMQAYYEPTQETGKWLESVQYFMYWYKNASILRHGRFEPVHTCYARCKNSWESWSMHTLFASVQKSLICKNNRFKFFCMICLDHNTIFQPYFWHPSNQREFVHLHYILVFKEKCSQNKINK